MEQSQQQNLEEFIGRRLVHELESEEHTDVISRTTDEPLEKSGEDVEQEKTDDAAVSLQPQSQLPTTSFTKIEKSLAGIGFFTPSSRRLKDQKVKEITFTRNVDGRRVEATARILPSAMYGLPITADQDKYLALQQMITTQLQSESEIKNPIRFRSADLFRILDRTDAGKNYREVNEWLDVMAGTLIVSKGVIWHAGKKRTVTDRFHVFDRAVSFGKELDDGSIADANYVWLSDWQLANINHNFLLPIDLEGYRKLRNHIAKALVPLLQIWLFASQKAGSFEKRYDELCEILNIRVYKTPSEILRQLKPSLDELTYFGYLAKWRIERTADKKAHKIVLFHGAKFHRDRRRRLEQKTRAEEPVIVGEYQPVDALPEHGKLREAEVPAGQTSPEATQRAGKRVQVELAADQAEVVTELTDRGVMKSTAVKLIRSISSEQLEDVRDQIDYWDSIEPDRARGKGPGLLLHFVNKKDPLPPSFETRRRRQERLAAEDRRQKLRALKNVLTEAYEKHRSAAVDRFIAEELPPGDFERRVASRQQNRSQQSGLWEKTPIRPELLEQLARNDVRVEIANEITIVSYEDFRQRHLPRILEEYQFDATELGIELPEQPVSEPKSTT